MLIVWALAIVSSVVGLVDAVQVLVGRQLLAPSRSRRTASQIRRQSAAAAVMMLGAAVFWSGVALEMSWLTGTGAAIALVGAVGLARVLRLEHRDR